MTLCKCKAKRSGRDVKNDLEYTYNNISIKCLGLYFLIEFVICGWLAGQSRGQQFIDLVARVDD